MGELFQDWRETGIDTRGKGSGQIKTLCPRCSADRTNKRDRCLSVNLTLGTWNCHHCGWVGGIKTETPDYMRSIRRDYTRPKYIPKAEDPSEKTIKWFESRGITKDVVLRNRIEARTAWMPQTEKDERVITFPYFRGNEVINVKYRTADKAFRMEKDAELILYGMDDIDCELPLIWVEGECDKLACEVAGMPNCVSVPNGTGTDLNVLAAAEPWTDGVLRHIMAGDNDVVGRKLEGELIRRLGPEKCWRVTWPAGCKDANEVLMKYGPEALADCINSASAVPIEGAFEIQDLEGDIYDLYDNGRPTGVYTGWPDLHQHYRPRPGEWTVISGSPGSGKSSLMSALIVNLAKIHDWQFAVYPPENMPPEEYASTLIEIYTGEPFSEGPRPRMSRTQVEEAMYWLNDHVVILNPPEGERNLDGLLALGKAYVYRRGITGFVIDPWNELEHAVQNGMTETQFIGQSLIKFRNFCRAYKVHGWIVAHPSKLPKESGGAYPVPTLYDISGSAHWFNKTDNGLVVWRNKQDDLQPVDIHIQKIRFRWCGKLGMVQLYYDKVTGRYSEKPGDFRQDWHNQEN